MDIKKFIEEEIRRILITDKNIVIENPPKEEMGDYCVQCASLRTEQLKSPMDVANYIKNNFNDVNNYFANISIMGPYINFYINYEIINEKVIKEVEDKNNSYGSLNQGLGESLLIEHTSINPNAEPHMGRIRNSLIGDFMSNLFKFTGYNVERHYFVNDLGTKIALLVIGIEKYKTNIESFSNILDSYVKINAEAKENEEINKQAFDYLELVENGNVDMINRFKTITDKCIQGQMKIFDYLNIHFDVFTHESDYVFNHYLTNILDKLKEKGKLCEDENGRYYVNLEGYDIPTKEPVLVLTRSNKTSLYPIKDLAYSIYKIGLNDKNNFIVLGEDQEVYMKQISSALDILGYKSPKLISYSYVLLGGNKMGSSTGISVLVSDFIKNINKTLVDEFNNRNIEFDEEKLKVLTNACIKFTMLNVSKHKIVNFNLENATSFTGESGIYILYSIVRINSILRTNVIDYNKEVKFSTPFENKLIKYLYSFPEVVNNLLVSQEPIELTKYIFNLTSEFSKYYENVNISNEANDIIKNSRLRLINCIKQTLTNALSILGIGTVDKM